MRLIGTFNLRVLFNWYSAQRVLDVRAQKVCMTVISSQGLWRQFAIAAMSNG